MPAKAPDMAALSSFFACWRIPGRPWTWVHWFKDGRTACGLEAPATAQIHIPPNPGLSCTRCIAAIQKRDAIDKVGQTE